MKILLCLNLLILVVYGFKTFSLNKAEGNDPVVWSFLTNNTFDFVVYKDHNRTKNVYKCYDYIYKSYQCLAREKQQEMVESLKNGKENDSVLKLLEQMDLSYVRYVNDNLKNVKKYSLIYSFLTSQTKYPALWAHIWWAGVYSPYIAKRGSPGVWSCFLDFLEKEYKEANDYTLQNNVLIQDGKMIKLYSGIRDPVLFNISKNDGNPNVEVNDTITVSGYLSTTTDKGTAIEFAQGRVTGPANHPIILVLNPNKTKSKVASLHDFLFDERQFEYLFPTNAAFKVTEILKEEKFDPEFKNQGLSYMLVVDEIGTGEIHREVEGRDPNEQDYICKYGFSSAGINSISFVLLSILVFLFI